MIFSEFISVKEHFLGLCVGNINSAHWLIMKGFTKNIDDSDEDMNMTVGRGSN